jgi:UDP-N-acetylmuramoyl-L-alanyl-D-glutamate--2,6-diaminopimelate ligase
MDSKPLGKNTTAVGVALENIFPNCLSSAADSSLTVPWQSLMITGMSEDSRSVSAGDLFVARDGAAFKGCDFIESAAQQGAVAALVENLSKNQTYIDLKTYSIPVIYVENLTFCIGKIAAKVHQNVSEKLNIIGITGTNGKTSCAHYLAQILNALGLKTYLIGTLGNGAPDALQESAGTTPDACRLHKMFAEFYQQGARAVVMEVSSHALEQGRVEGVAFNTIAYTNLSRDHLDYHANMQAYAAAKNRLFTDFAATNRILNLDDSYNRDLLLSLEDVVGVTTYSESGDRSADFVAEKVSLANGLVIKVSAECEGQLLGFDIRANVLGKFNVATLLLCTAVLTKIGYSRQQIEQSMAQVVTVPGRMQSVVFDPHLAQTLCIVDYAHTPDALEKALQASRFHCQHKLILVFGCGGDRDAGKRAEMAKIAEQFADQIIVTSDNPRAEDPVAIIAMIAKGFSLAADYSIENDRRKAIFQAISLACKQDVVLIAGKGHEDYQEIMGIKQPFLDADVVLEGLSSKQRMIGENN